MRAAPALLPPSVNGLNYDLIDAVNPDVLTRLCSGNNSLPCKIRRYRVNTRDDCTSEASWRPAGVPPARSVLRFQASVPFLVPPAGQRRSQLHSAVMEVCIDP